MLYCVYEVKQDKILVINIASLLFIYNKQSAYKISALELKTDKYS